MENASKALIIAGAILLAIAIIGIGMYVFSVAQSGAGEVDMTAEQATSYNAKFISYEGVKKGSEVRALLNTVTTHNAANSGDTAKQIVVLDATATNCASATDDNTAGSIDADVAKGKIIPGKQYTVSIGYTTTGLVKRIGIVAK